MVVIVVTFIVAIVLTKGEYDDPNGYGHKAVLSPTKLYHNIVLYGAYGYVIVVTLIAVVAWMIASASWNLSGMLVVCLIPGMIWACLLAVDQNASEETKESRLRNAHVTEWKPIWSR